MHTPEEIYTVKDMLKSMNLEALQKHPSFHILKVEDHIDDIARKSDMISKNIFEFTYGVNYNIEITVDEVNFLAKEGHLTFLSPGQSFYMDIPEDFVYEEEKSLAYLIFFTTDFLTLGPTNYSIIKKFPYFNRHITPVYYINGEVEKTYLGYIEKLYDEFQNLNEDNIEVIRAYLTILLFETKKLALSNDLKSSTHSRAEEITYQFESLLKKTTCKKQTLSYYSSQLHISNVYLSECVKKATGSSAKQLITQYMIFEAKHLLSISKNKLDDIASTLGFNDTSNFIIFFKKHTALTPNQFRKTLLSERNPE